MMKKFLIVLLAVLFSAVVLSAAEVKDIAFSELTYDFGTIKADNGPVSHEFVFTNNADEPLIVLSASASCGCTKPKFSNEPVKPGKPGKIDVTFLPKGQKGYIKKVVRVRYKIAGDKVKNVTLKISGNVIP